MKARKDRRKLPNYLRKPTGTSSTGKRTSGMDFIDASNMQQPILAYCPSELCGGQMLLVQKGKLAGNYICQSCGTTIDPALEYLKHEDELGSIMSDEQDNEGIAIVQPDEPTKKDDYLLDWASREIKTEIERGGRKQVVSISGTFVNPPSGSKINRIERPQKL